MSEQNPYLLYPEHQMDRRPRYYDGQFLKADDFNDVQRYEIDRRRRHLEATVRAGVVSGLDLTPAADQLTVSAGAAIDDIGRQIVLVEAQTKAIAAEDRGQTLLLYIVWSETASDEAEGDEGTAGFTRFHELPAISYVQSGAALPDHAVVLATVNVDADGNVEADTTARPRAGLRIPGPTPLTLTSDEADPGRATLTAALRVTVPDGTAHDPEAPALDIDGDARITGGLTVGQDSATGYQGAVNDGDDIIVSGQIVAAGNKGSALFKLGVGYAPPTQGEGTLITQRIGVGRTTVTTPYTLDVTGDAHIDGALDITEQLTLSAPLLIEGAGATIGGASTIDGTLDVAGRLDADGLAIDGATTLDGDVDLNGPLDVQGTLSVESGTLDLGAGVAGRHENAGKIVYDGFDITGLSIFGAGTSVANRKINLYGAGGIVAAGPTDVDGALTATSLVTDAAITAGTTLTATGKATLNGGFDAVGHGSITGRLTVGQTGADGYGGVTADSNDLVVNGQFAAGGSGGAAMYSLAIGTDAQSGKEGYLFVGNRIGINNPSPSKRLDVSGTARFTGDTEVGGALDVTGKVTTADDLTVGGTLYADPGEGRGFTFGTNVAGGSGDLARISYWEYSSTGGHNYRLEIKNTNDADDIIALNQYNTDVITLRNGRCGIAESDPDVNLHVSGRIKINDDYALCSKGEAARVLWGQFNADASSVKSRGMSASWNASSKYYQISFGVTFTSQPAVIAQVISSGTILKDNTQVHSITTSGCRVTTGDDNFDRVQREFSVMAIGDCY